MADKEDLSAYPPKEPGKVKNDPVTLTVSHVQQIFNMSSARANEWHPIIKKYCDEGQITTVFRLAAFLAQVHVETAGLTVLVGNLNYSAEGLLKTFPKYFRGRDMALAYARNPEKIANYVYANRMGNGNEASGDGWRYRDRGAIQLTGFYNYDLCNKAGILCLGANAPYLETKEGAMRSAVWYWGHKTLNRSADAGDFREVCTRVNGGHIGFQKRLDSYVHNIKVLTGIPNVEPDPDKPTDAPRVTPDVNRDTQEYHPNPEAPHKNFTETVLKGSAQYPWNQARESRSGHLIEIDDTPGRERLHWYHRTGTYVEIQPNGSRVTKVMKDDRLFVKGNSFLNVTGNVTEVVDGSVFEKVKGDQTTNLGGAYFITAPADMNVNTPNANFSGALNANNITAKFYKMRRGTEFGNVADMRVRSACHATYAERASGLASDPNPQAKLEGRWEGGNWTYSSVILGIVNRRAGGVLGFEPAPDSRGHSEVSLEGDMEIHSVKGLNQTVQKDSVLKTNGDKYDGVGGDRLNETSGSRIDHTGEEHVIKSDLSLKLDAPVTHVTGAVVYDPILKSQLPSAVELAGKALTAFVDGRVRTYVSDGENWKEQK